MLTRCYNLPDKWFKNVENISNLIRNLDFVIIKSEKGRGGISSMSNFTHFDKFACGKRIILLY